MNIKSSFLTSLVSDPKIPNGWKPEIFLGQIYIMQESTESPLFQALAGGIIKASPPYSFDIQSMDCFLLLYTKKGCGKLSVDNHSYTLVHPSLLILNCRKRFRIDVAIAPWEYQVLFISGSSLPYYESLLSSDRIPLTPVNIYSETALNLDRLLNQCESSTGTGSSLIISDLINRIITDCILYQLKEQSKDISLPNYLEEIRSLFDNAFQENYSLDELEKRFSVSKYRLCREFHSAFGMSPLQYLNKRRIDIAIHLLLTTGHKIHEIGSMVGIDNTNHFITLFKKFTGYTPLEYKQRKTF